MLDNLLSVLPEGNERHPLKYFRMIDTLHSRFTIAKAKFMAAPLPRTQGVETLRWMLLNFNLNKANEYPQDISMFTEFIENYQDEFRTAFDPVWTKQLSHGNFIRCKGNSHPAEIFINCSVDNPASYYPFGQDWNSWKGLRALRLIYTNSTELPIDMFTGYITFTVRKPTFAVISLNVPTLLMKWVKYTKYCKDMNQTPNELEFLKTSEYSHLWEDLLNNWTNNMLTLVLENPKASSELISSELVVPAFLTTGSIIRDGIDSLKEILNLIDSRNLRLQDFLATPWYYDDATVLDRIDDLNDFVKVPEMRNYTWIELAKSLPYLRLITAVIDRDPDNPIYNQLLQKAYWEYVHTVKYAQLPSLQYLPALKTYVTMVSNHLEKVFKGKIQVPVETTTQV